MNDDGHRGCGSWRKWLRNPVVVFAIVEALVLIPVVVYLILR